MFAFLRRGIAWRRGNARRSIEGLWSSEAFEQQLRKERARTDRGAGSFTLLALRIDAPPDSEAFLQAAWVLSALLNQRTRFIDTKGWFGDRIGVIFPNTPSASVVHIWPPIKEAFDQRSHSASAERSPLPTVTFEVYAYPEEELTGAPRG
ncbi:MAG TPA: hypothetical protein PKI11_18810 [Candidatus Hydrogenedentes bacterium]|nr:hypothetical protein [Candidatus Hydrogenedentota bacterium]HNT89235.1 hypothetical protein [Candidatus Hydrogenedentota bacterium]